MPHLLSKSKYIRGLQCERALWLDVHSPRLARYSREQMQRFSYGRSFEQYVKNTFKGGIDVSAALGRDVDSYPAYTAQLLDREDSITLFEAGFQYDDVLVLADVVVKQADNSLLIYEIKSGNELSSTYQRDAALQYYVISNCRQIQQFCVIHASDEGEKYVTIDLTARLRQEAHRVAKNVADMKPIAIATSEPDTPTGQHCLTPYPCPYQHHCLSGARQLSLF